MHGCEERMEAQRSTKVAPWCKHCSYVLRLVKSTSRDEVILIIEEIKSVALAVLELRLSEGISKYISKSVNRKICLIQDF